MKGQYWYNLADVEKQAAKQEYESARFGLSAYHSQQYIEKTIKGVITQLNLTSYSMEKLSHLPFYKLWSEAWNSITASPDKELEQIVPKLQPGIHAVQKIFDDLVNRSDPSAKIIWWKLSLEIELSASESRQLILFSNDLKESVLSLIEPTMDLLNMYTSVLKGQSIECSNRIVKIQPQPKIEQEVDSLLKEIRAIDITKSDNSNIAYHFVSFSTKAIILYTKIHPGHSKKRRLKRRHLLAYLILCIIINSLVLLKIFPHEEYGRYPRPADSGTDMMMLYESRQKELEKLENEVDDVCMKLKSLSESIKPLRRA